MGIRNSIYKRLEDAAYNIGFLFDIKDEDLIYKSGTASVVKWVDLNGYKDGWFADPFILHADENVIEVLVEEWNYEKSIGRISKLIIDKNSLKLTNIIPLLENGSHFSFPNIWREDEKIFVYPENFQGGGLYLYEYDKQNEKLINPFCLVNEPLLDSQILKHEDSYYIFAIKESNGNKQCNIQYVYKADFLKGPYSLVQTIENKRREERGAGAIFINNGKIIRPAQSCEIDYGESVVFYELKCNDKVWIENVIGRLNPNKKDNNYNLRLHTYNRYENIIVVDGYDYFESKSRLLHKLLLIARKLKRLTEK